MSVSVLLAAISGILFASLSLVYKYAENHECRFSHFTFVTSVVAAIFSFIPTFFQITNWQQLPLWTWSAVMAAFTVAGIFIVMYSNKLGPVYINWVIINVSFMLAIFLSALVFKEQVLLIDFINMLIFAAVLFFFSHGIKQGVDPQKTTHPMLFAVVLAGVFLVNGIVAFGGKIKFAAIGEHHTAAFTCALYIFAALFTLPVILKDKKLVNRQELIAGVLAGFCFSVGTILFYAAMKGPAAAVFPTTQGVSMLGGVTLSTIVGKERLNRWTVMGIFLGVIVLLMIVFRLQITAYFSR